MSVAFSLLLDHSSSFFASPFSSLHHCTCTWTWNCFCVASFSTFFSPSLPALCCERRHFIKYSSRGNVNRPISSCEPFLLLSWSLSFCLPCRYYFILLILHCKLSLMQEQKYLRHCCTMRPHLDQREIIQGDI